MKSPYILHKAIAIPVNVNVKAPVFLTVLDRRHSEWIFVTGGCRKTEIDNPLKCALRELHEETRGAVSIMKGMYSYFHFNLKTKCMKLGDVMNIYHVYIIDYDPSIEKQKELIDNFEESKKIMNDRKNNNQPIRRAWDENDKMTFETLDEFTQKTVWEVISKNVVNNPEFKNALNSQNRKYFDIIDDSK